MNVPLLPPPPRTTTPAVYFATRLCTNPYTSRPPSPPPPPQECVLEVILRYSPATAQAGLATGVTGLCWPDGDAAGKAVNFCRWVWVWVWVGLGGWVCGPGTYRCPRNRLAPLPPPHTHTCRSVYCRMHSTAGHITVSLCYCGAVPGAHPVLSCDAPLPPTHTPTHTHARRSLLGLAQSGHSELEGVVVGDVVRAAISSLGHVATVMVQTQVGAVGACFGGERGGGSRSCEEWSD